jgi:hypothetical protein
VKKEEEREVDVGSVVHGESETLKTQEFWDDLKGFLIQRLKNESEGDKLFGVFRTAWETQK